MAIAFPEPSDRPAFAGGVPLFPDGLKLCRPAVAATEQLGSVLLDIVASGALTNGRYVAELERRAAEYLGVRHCIAVSSCTSGLMLLLRASELSGDVIVPSFTFAATAHAVAWAGLRPVFADIDPQTLTLSPRSVMRATGVRAAAILATHTYGTPADVEGLDDIARRNGIRLFFDAAHAFGSLHGGRHVGTFGDAEVFSLSPTKVLVAAEGGIIATQNDVLAERCRIGRDYGNPGDYDCRFIGLNARMSELHAAVALASLDDIEDRIRDRNALADHYGSALGTVPGITLPVVPPDDRSTYKDFTVLVDPEAFGTDARTLASALAAEGIETRRYYDPPVHRMRAYERLAASTNGSLATTDYASRRVLCLPLWSGMSDEDVDRVCEAIQRIGLHMRSHTEGVRHGI